jgi:tight adherence protein B
MLIVALVFVGVFTLVALPLLGSGLVPSRTRNRRWPLWIRRSRPRARRSASWQMNLRKNENLSSIPWLNKKLLKLEIDAVSAQDAESGGAAWSAGRLLIMSAALFCVPAYAVLQYVVSIPVALGAGVVLGGLRLAGCCSSAAGDLTRSRRDCRKRWT